MSFDECTAMSMRFASSASSISLVNSAFAACFRQRPVLDAVAAGRDHLDDEGVFRQIVRRHQTRARLMRLGERQRASARSDP